MRKIFKDKVRKQSPVERFAKSEHKASVWRGVCILSMVFNAIFVVSGSIAYVKGVDVSQVRFLVSPPVPDFVRPGEIPQAHVEQVFEYAVGLTNGFTYESIEGNYKKLFKSFYGKELENITRANLKAERYIEEVRKNQAVSVWRYLPEESQYRWCDKVQYLKHVRGVACGIVTGEQTLYYNNNNPIKKRKISYLVFGVGVYPDPDQPGKNMFGVNIVRMKRAQKKILERQLNEAVKTGVLPIEEQFDVAAY